MPVNSREELKQYALRSLGGGVVDINVSDEQLEDRLDDALEFWRENHYDGIEKLFMKHQITASSIRILESVSNQFTLGSEITGGTSGATATVFYQENTTEDLQVIYIRDPKGTFQDGESITDGTTTATIDANGFTPGDFDNQYIPIPDLIYGVNRIFPLSSNNSSSILFNPEYQLYARDLYDLQSGSLINYSMSMQHLSLLNNLLNTETLLRFNRYSNKLFLDTSWNTKIHPGDYLIVDCYRALDPSEYSRMWNNDWLKRFTTATFKKQWATNLQKYQGMQLPGGITIDALTMFDQATTEIAELKEELIQRSAPLEFFLG